MPRGNGKSVMAMADDYIYFIENVVGYRLMGFEKEFLKAMFIKNFNERPGSSDDE